MLCQMLKHGMNVARFNFSHGDHPTHKQALDNVREAVKKTGINCATMLDTKGPEVRTGFLKDHKSVLLKRDQLLEISISAFSITHARFKLCASGRFQYDHLQLEESFLKS